MIFNFETIYYDKKKSALTAKLNIALSTRDKWRSNDYVNALRLMDDFSMEWRNRLYK